MGAVVGVGCSSLGGCWRKDVWYGVNSAASVPSVSLVDGAEVAGAERDCGLCVSSAEVVAAVGTDRCIASRNPTLQATESQVRQWGRLKH
jgi:hypothetical protein